MTNKTEKLTCTICGGEDSADQILNVIVNRNHSDPNKKKGLIHDACNICIPMLLVAGNSVEKIRWNFPDLNESYMSYTPLVATSKVSERTLASDLVEDR